MQIISRGKRPISLRLVSSSLSKERAQEIISSFINALHPKSDKLSIKKESGRALKKYITQFYYAPAR